MRTLTFCKSSQETNIPQNLCEMVTHYKQQVVGSNLIILLILSVSFPPLCLRDSDHFACVYVDNESIQNFLIPRKYILIVIIIK